MVASMQQQDGVCVAPLVQFGNQVEQGEGLEALGMSGGVAQVMLQAGGDAQVLQVLSLKDAQVLTKAMVSIKQLYCIAFWCR
uniref:Uncharacterized protein n=1 Tax=Heliothis virescens TaxID=7102 RepID=A0A2A4JF97_HELVI